MTDRRDGPLLVLGDDGSPPSDRAWRWVTSQSWRGWSIEVLTADDRAPIEWGAPPRTEAWTPTWARTEPIEGAAAIRFIKVATDPRAMLADRDDADLMVLGLRTHSYLEAMVTGSTTEWILHHPPTPLVVATEPDPVHRVVACVDGSDHALAALTAFLRAPFSSETRVEVLAVDDGRTDSAAAIEAGQRRLDGRVADVTGLTLEGSPTPVILQHLEETTPDLVVMGTRGLTGWKRLRLGSTASAVVRGSPCTSLVASTDAINMDSNGGE